MIQWFRDENRKNWKLFEVLLCLGVQKDRFKSCKTMRFCIIQLKRKNTHEKATIFIHLRLWQVPRWLAALANQNETNDSFAYNAVQYTHRGASWKYFSWVKLNETMTTTVTLIINYDATNLILFRWRLEIHPWQTQLTTNKMNWKKKERQ